jgi:hypothetical protein
MAVLVVPSLFALLSACGGSSDGAESVATVDSAAGDAATTVAQAEHRVRLREIRSAVALVEERLGGPQRYSEVNATQAEVNVFVIAGGMDDAYVVKDGVLSEPTSLGPYTGKTFGADDIKFVPGVLDKIVQTIRDSEIVAFSVTPSAQSGVDYIATVTAPSGEFRVLLAADGNVLATS